MSWKPDTSETFMVNAKSAQPILSQIPPKLNVNHVSQAQEKFSNQLDFVHPALIIPFQTQQACSAWMSNAQVKLFFQTEPVKPAQIILPHFGMRLPKDGHVKHAEESLLELTKSLKLMVLAAIAMLSQENQVLAKMVISVSATWLMLTTESALSALQKKTKS
jgi:hypothetical protein